MRRRPRLAFGVLLSAAATVAGGAFAGCEGDGVVAGDATFDAAAADSSAPSIDPKRDGSSDAALDVPDLDAPKPDAPELDAPAPDASDSAVPCGGGLLRGDDAVCRNATVLTTGLNHAKRIALGGTSVFVSVYEDATVLRIDRDGGASSVVADEFEDAYDVAFDQGRLVAVNATQTGQVLELALDGGAHRLIADGQDFPSAVAVQGDDVVWATRKTVNAGGVGLAPRVLASNQAGPHGVAIAGDVAVWSSYFGGEIWRADVHASPTVPTVLVAGLANPAGIVVRDQIVYFTSTGDGTVKSVPVAGGPVVTLASGLGYPREIAADDVSLYVTCADGTVARVARSGGGAFILVRGRNSPEGIAVDAASVYWVEGDQAGALVRLTPK